MDKEKVLKVCNQIADKGLLKTLEIKFTDVGNDFLPQEREHILP